MLDGVPHSAMFGFRSRKNLDNSTAPLAHSSCILGKQMSLPLSTSNWHWRQK